MTREILHVGLGSPACHVSAHYLNLQGLSVTTASSSNETVEQQQGARRNGPSCEPATTHTSFQNVLVPRALLIDESADSFGTTADTLKQQPAVEDNHHASTGYEMHRLSLDESRTLQSSAVWSGPVERLNYPKDFQQQSSREESKAANNFLLTQVRDSASKLSHSPYSRYRVPHGTEQSRGYSISSNQRTVDWDDLPEEEEEEDEDERRDRERHQEIHWNQHVHPQLQDQLDSFWLNVVDSDNRVADNVQMDATKSSSGNPKTLALSWRDYWMPPFHPNSAVNLPVSRKNINGEHVANSWDHYYPVCQSNALGDWVDHEFLDQVRQMLENCDSCQGFTIASSGHGAYAGLTTKLLQYLKDDCPGARRMVWMIDDDRVSKNKSVASGSDDATTWRTYRVERTRNQMEVGLMWHDFIDSAHGILDLNIPSHKNREHDIFYNSAALAAALETATLPYRLSSKGDPSWSSKTPASRIGLKSYYYGDYSGDSSFGSVMRMSFSDFLTNLIPSPGLSVLELDTLLPSTNLQDSSVWPQLLEGTSLERDHRMKSEPQKTGIRRTQEVLPGRWMMGTREGGVLSSFSPNRLDRTKHSHFALASSFRFGSTSEAQTPNHCVDCLMEGMGIRYRPEQSFAAHVNESLSNLTNSGYGAGSYWKYCWGPKPVLSVIGNTTRFHPRASQIGEAVKQVLSRQNRGFFNRDTASAILPEEDDCHEVLSTIYNIRDRYQPPRGTGLDNDDDDYLFMD